MQVNYTWAHALDDGVKTILDPDSTNSNQAPQERFDDKGNSFNDIRHNIRANLIYHAPDIKSDKFYAKPLHGWWFGTIVSWQTGYPITITNGDARNLQGSVDTIDRPNLDPSFNPNTVVTGNPTGWINPTMFDTQVAGTLGNAGKGIARGPKLADQDFSINKDTRLKWLGEAGNLEFRAEYSIYITIRILQPLEAQSRWRLHQQAARLSRWLQASTESPVRCKPPTPPARLRLRRPKTVRSSLR